MKKIIFILMAFLGGQAMAAPMETGRHEAYETAVLAGGCFWCVQPPFDNSEGVLKTVVGYTGGETADPTYEQIGTGRTGHREAILVEFDPKKTSYPQMLKVFLENIDPFDAGGQYVDRGSQYTTAIYYLNPTQEKQAHEAVAALEKSSGKKVAVQVLPAKPFYAAEDYHQDYYKKNPTRYKMYKYGSGR